MQHWPGWVGNLNLVSYLAVHIALHLTGVYSSRKMSGGGGWGVKSRVHSLIWKRISVLLVDLDQNIGLKKNQIIEILAVFQGKYRRFKKIIRRFICFKGQL